MSFKRMAVASVAVMVVLILLLQWIAANPSQDGNRATLLLYCAAGLKPAIDPAIMDYQANTGIRIEVQFGGSGTLLSNLQVAKKGDLYLAADDSYLTTGLDRGILAEITPLVSMAPVIAVARGNPLGLNSLKSLLREDVRLVLPNPESAAIGRRARAALMNGNQWQQLAERARTLKPTVNDLANDLKLGSADAAIMWDATVEQYPELEALPGRFFGDTTATVGIAVIQGGSQPEAATDFIRFLQQPSSFSKYFKPHGYTALNPAAP